MKISYIVFTIHISIHISKYNYNIKINYPLLHNIQRYTQHFLFDRTVEEAPKCLVKLTKAADFLQIRVQKALNSNTSV